MKKLADVYSRPRAMGSGGEGEVPARALQVNNKIPLRFVSHPNTIARRPDGRRAVGERRRLPLLCRYTCRTPPHICIYLYKLLLYRMIHRACSCALAFINLIMNSFNFHIFGIFKYTNFMKFNTIVSSSRDF